MSLLRWFVAGGSGRPSLPTLSGLTTAGPYNPGCRSPSLPPAECLRSGRPIPDFVAAAAALENSYEFAREEVRQIRSSYDVLRCVLFVIGYTPFENYNWELVSSSSDPAPKTSSVLHLTFQNRNYFEETNSAYCKFLKSFCRKCFCVLIGNHVPQQNQSTTQDFCGVLLNADDLGAEQSGFGHQPGRQVGLVADMLGGVVSWSELVESAIRRGQLEASGAVVFAGLKSAHERKLNKALKAVVSGGNKHAWKVRAAHEEHGEEVAKFIIARGDVFGVTLLAWLR